MQVPAVHSDHSVGINNAGNMSPYSNRKWIIEAKQWHSGAYTSLRMGHADMHGHTLLNRLIWSSYFDLFHSATSS